MAGDVRYIVSCEHGGNEVPTRWTALFDTPGARKALEGHRGWDPGSLEMGRRMARALHAPLVAQRVSRLLVECNRSLDHPRLWSEFSRVLTPEEKEEVLTRYWRSHRDAVRREVTDAAAAGRVVHVSVHTFTPVWQGRRRATDVGLLYDPTRTAEWAVARSWKRALGAEPATAGFTVHLNRPYRGWTDGLVTALRREIPGDRYVGFELEISQSLAPLPAGTVDAVARALRSAVAHAGTGDLAC